MGQDGETVEQFFERFVEAWRANDGETVAGLFVDDGALINPFGERADGHGAVAAMYSDYFGGLLRDTRTTFELDRVRSVETSHAFADGQQTIYAADGNVVLVAHMAALLRRESGGWRFVDARPYTVPVIPD